FMASNLTTQVRNIALVATAVAQGDLSQKIDVDARGEILELKTTLNTMVDTLSSFASEVTRVAREVGSEGQLGGQARVEGVYGTWKSLTTSVNELASNLTTQVRAIAEVTSAVASGDMTRNVTVEARGEVAKLKNNINMMVSNLRETTRAKDWLDANLARLAGLMQGHRDLVEVADLILRELTPLVNAQYGAFFLASAETDELRLDFIAGYGSAHDASIDTPGSHGHGLVRQAAIEKKRILVEDVPSDYIKVDSGLGEAAPTTVVIIPVLFEDQTLGVIELASFSRFSDVHLAFFDQFVNTIGVAINTIVANSRTESLLSESQRLARQLQERTGELQRRQAELQRSNAALEEKAALLASSSRYKTEFLANMSHELRNPLNSLLILAQMLIDNEHGHLSRHEVESAAMIHRSGSELLQLINDILDLSKIEAGRMDVFPSRVPINKLLSYVHDTFRPLTLDRGLAFEVSVTDAVPKELYSDEKRIKQVLRNLLSNALKFTSKGKIDLSVDQAGDETVTFTVTDTGIGIAPEKLPVIFEAFQQADGTTNRKYGGTGLGLSISREIAGLLGGALTAESEPGVGSTFVFRIPVRCRGTADALDQPSAAPAVPGVPAGGPEGAAAGTPPEPPRPLVPVPAGASDDVSWPAVSNVEQWAKGATGELLSGAQALVVDDDIRNAFALTNVLSRVGMRVVYAEHGREAIEMLGKNPGIDFVLMDIMMPEMDGYETIRAIRRTPRYADLPVVVLTAKAMPGDREKSLETGANDYLPKPLDVDRLLNVAVDLLSKYRSSAPAPEGAAVPSPDGDAPAAEGGGAGPAEAADADGGEDRSP
ncbi:hybrid sensor histidine kinase/response regulator, partial [Streptomyces sp. Ru73]|uniref:ATP-binding protein n=1 Tax=Streptomyces sp. Ru73 TaxID=2080748 RepID=UPI000D457E89